MPFGAGVGTQSYMTGPAVSRGWPFDTEPVSMIGSGDRDRRALEGCHRPAVEGTQDHGEGEDT